MRKAFVNGNFYTMKAEGDCCEAVVVENGRFLYCGGNEKAKAMTGGGEITDLKGLTVLPGFIDTHQHVRAYARDARKVNLRDVRSLAELQEKIRERAANTPAGELIMGAGFDHEKFPVPVLPTKEDLDKAAPNHPVIVNRYCVHMNAANSLALEAGGIRRGYVPPIDNSVEFDEHGEPTGRLWEQSAADLAVRISAGTQSQESIKNDVESALRLFNSYGVTGVHPIQGKLCDLFEDTYVYQALRDEGRLTARIYMGHDEMPACGIRTGLGDDMVKYGFFKIYTDGSLGARSAMLTKPYSDAPEQRGVMNHSQEELNRLVKEAYDQDIQVGVHMIGDKAIEMSLTALEACYFANPKPNARFRMIHTSLINEEIIARMKKLPVICDIQPSYVSTNIHWSKDRVGERSPYLFAWRRLIDEGFILSGSSDCPVEPVNPMVGIYASTTRVGYDGYMAEGWHPEQRISRYEAVSLYTKNGAYASFEENTKGSIEEGKLADFTVFDKDVFKVSDREILTIKAKQTRLGGQAVYTAPLSTI